MCLSITFTLNMRNIPNIHNIPKLYKKKEFLNSVNIFLFKFRIDQQSFYRLVCDQNCKAKIYYCVSNLFTTCITS